MPLQDELKKKHPFDSATEEAYLNLIRTYHRLNHRFAQLFKQHGLSDSSYNILRILRGVHRFPEAGRPELPSNEIAQRLITSVPDLPRLISRLEAEGLVQRRRSTRDKRVVFISITEAGLERLRELDQPVQELHDRCLGHLEPQELAELSDLLAKARDPDLGPPV
jgi:DNA-binding MarR family transcriptional regulator